METATDALAPDDIDLEFVARLVPELEVATIGDDQIVIGGATQLIVLNPTAALIFQFLDGDASLGELVDDFTDALGVDRAVVEEDVLVFVRDLGANGLLEGVALPRPELPDPGDWAPPEPIEVGDELDDFTLLDLDGNERALADFRGRRVLLVNWSPGCGFCVKIAAELGALHPVLGEHDVELVFVTSGDVEANRAVFDPAPVTALLRDGTDVDPFGGTGTPAAYLIDADGRLAESMVVGADQVPVLARDLAGVDPATPFGAPALLDPADDGPVDHDGLADDGPRGRYLPAPGAMCGPGGGGGASNSTEWTGTRAYAIQGYHVGVRYDAPETAEVLDRLFAGSRVNDRRAPDNYSVALGGTPTTKGSGASRSLKLLVHGSTQLVRSRSGGRVLHALLQYLTGDLTPVDPSSTRVAATAVVRDGEAMLLPAGLVDFVKQLQPRFARAGLCLVDTPRTLVDLSARQLVVPEPAVAHDPSVIAELDAGVTLGRELPWVRPGRYPLRTWFLAREPDLRGPMSTAQAVTAALPKLFELDDLRGEVERLADLFSDVDPYALWYVSADDLVDQVTAALV
jgi:thiol-disulfide isomerase/thioredoxin